MNRLSAWPVLVLLLSTAGLAADRRVALTFDDLPGVAYPREDACNVEKIRAWNVKLTSRLKDARVPALGLVVDGNLCEAQRRHLPSLYDEWLSRGFELGNHTFSHRDFNRQELEWFQEDIVRGETSLRPLLAARRQRIRYFRHPFLRSGTELAKKRNLEDFLSSRGYLIAPVTIDNEEYVYANAYVRALEREDEALQARIAADYIRHIEEMFAFYETLSRDTLGYEPPQILLLHMNALNADHLPALLEMIRGRSYRVVSIEQALRDRAYRTRDTYIGARGLSWIQRWRVTKGLPARPEPSAPDWIWQIARDREPRVPPR